jgi:hypothetical protein
MQYNTVNEARNVLIENGFEVREELDYNLDGILREYLIRNDGARAEITVFDGEVTVAYYGLPVEELVQLDRAKAERLLAEERALIAEGSGFADRKRAAQLEAALAA